MLIFSAVFLLCIAVFLIDLRAYHLLKIDDKVDIPSDLPPISILIAARDEEKNIANCLESLLEQQYPIEKIEILVANDMSKDMTAAILRNYTLQYPHIRVVDIKENQLQLNGKANALAQLAKYATGEHLLFTDADVVVPVNWAANMVAAVRKETGIVTGVTLIKAKFLFALFQSFDWAIALAYIQVLGSKKVAVTAMGNNMLITKEAYQKSGGFENTKGSLTEDFAIFKNVVKAGFGYRIFFNPDVLAYTKAQVSFKELLDQRKRWMRGAMKLPVILILLLLLQGLFFPALIIMFFYSKIMAFALFGLKLTVQTLLLFKTHEILKLRPRFFLYFLYEPYHMFLTLCLMMYYFVPVKLSWKGRKY